MRIPALDGLRGIAILMVVVGHAYPYTYGLGGTVGVTLFFVLSGFLITQALIKDGKLASFYWRRFLRLYPALIPFLLLAAAVLGWGLVWPVAFYMSNIVQIAGHDLWPLTHTWSLSVEEHFYLLWPLFFTRASRKTALVALPVGIVLSIVWRLSVDSDLWAYQGTVANAYALLLGCLLALVSTSPRALTRTTSAPVAVLIVLGFLPVDAGSFLATGRWASILAAGLSFLAVGAAAGVKSSWLATKPLRHLGRLSYSWYLWHLPLIAWVGAVHPGWEPLGALISLVVAQGSWRYLERPILEWAENRRSIKRAEMAGPRQPSPATRPRHRGWE